MRYLTVEECHAIGLKPHSVIGNEVHSLKHSRGRPAQYGSVRYFEAVKAVDRLKASLARPPATCEW